MNQLEINKINLLKEAIKSQSIHLNNGDFESSENELNKLKDDLQALDNKEIEDNNE